MPRKKIAKRIGKHFKKYKAEYLILGLPAIPVSAAVVATGLQVRKNKKSHDKNVFAYARKQRLSQKATHKLLERSRKATKNGLYPFHPPNKRRKRERKVERWI